MQQVEHVVVDADRRRPGDLGVGDAQAALQPGEVPRRREVPQVRRPSNATTSPSTTNRVVRWAPSASTSSG
ncbi:MAG: hypothetical protein ACRDNS_07850 [Trebonia sp.]